MRSVLRSSASPPSVADLIVSLHNHRDCACGPCEATIATSGNTFLTCDAAYELDEQYTCAMLESSNYDCSGCECPGDGTQAPTLAPTPAPSITYRPTPKPTAVPTVEPTPEKLECYMLTMEDSSGAGWGDGEWQWLSNGEVQKEGTLSANGYDGDGDGSYADTGMTLCTFSGSFCYELVVTTTQTTSSYYLQVRAAIPPCLYLAYLAARSPATPPPQTCVHTLTHTTTRTNRRL